MKKNKMMRLASILLVCVLLTTSVIGGTFAKYVTSVDSSDKARVAYWGFQSDNSMDITGLFSDTYGTTVDSVNGDDVIAPGTAGSTTFQFAWDEDTTAWEGAKVNVTGPEVAYNFSVKVDEVCDDLITGNTNIQWRLNKTVDGTKTSGSWGTWDALISSILSLSGTTTTYNGTGSQTVTTKYDPNTLPAGFTSADETYTIEWQWLINDVENETDAQNVKDTAMGNAQLLDDVSITITITASQIDN